MPIYNIDKMPTQSFIDKLAKNHAFLVLAANLNVDEKKIRYMVSVNDSKSEVRELTFDDACKSFGWKSFTFSKDMMYVIPTCDEQIEKTEVTWTEDKENPDHIVHTDKHWLKNDGYNWLSELRITNPMNITDPATAKINESMHGGKHVAVGLLNTNSFWNGIKLSDRMLNDNDGDESFDESDGTSSNDDAEQMTA